MHLNFLFKNKLNLEKLIKNLLPSSHYELLINFKNKKILSPLSSKLLNKFHNLQQKQNPEFSLTLNKHKRLNLFDSNKDPWIVNLTSQPIPDNVLDTLRMGERFSSQFIRKKSDQVIELVKDLESNITKIPIDDRQSFRNTFIEVSHQYIRKQQHINAFEKSLAKNITLTNKFLHENKDILLPKLIKVTSRFS